MPILHHFNSKNHCFNGAITFSLWKSGRTKMKLCFILGCFNGAITFSLWKLFPDVEQKAAPTPLQWGHNFFVMEILEILAYLCPNPTLQWGHNFFVMEIFLFSKKVKLLTKLQWGHNFFVMEIATTELTEGTMFTLQWGHNFFVMEI